MTLLSQFFNSTVNIEKPDGTQLSSTKANVSEKCILIFDAQLSVEKGDTISRELPNGYTERFEAIDFHYTKRLKGIPSHFRIQYRKL